MRGFLLMKNGFLLIRAKFLQKILLIKKLYVPVSIKINQSTLATASYPFVDLPPGNPLRCKLFSVSKF